MQPYSFGYNLKFVRHLRRLTRAQLAELAGIHYDSVRRIEQSDRAPWLRTVTKLAKALNCHEYTLLGLRPGTEPVKREVKPVKREVKRQIRPVEPLIEPLKSTFDRQLFAKRLREAREHTGLLQRQVSALVGKTEHAYGFYETGRIEPALDVLVTLAKIYHVSVDWLLGLKQLEVTS